MKISPYLQLVMAISFLAGSIEARACPEAKTWSTQDPLAQLLRAFGHISGPADDCPRDVTELVRRIRSAGLTVRPAMVANRGFHNPGRGSFSFFEQVTGEASDGLAVQKGEFFFGHFTHKRGGELALDQEGRPGQLLIEAIVWDRSKEMFNFYELLGGHPARWLYRGDSRDAYLDNRDFRLQTNPRRPRFGQRMRCSGCHNTGGPILKELVAPHNDWWTSSRSLPLGTDRVAPEVAGRIARLVDATVFASSVRAGMSRLAQSRTMKRFVASRSLREQLRPVFATQELNLISEQSRSGARIRVRADYWVNPTLVGRVEDLTLSRTNYQASLTALGSRFPETNRQDADHAWLAPVKALADHLAVQKLVQSRLIDREFVSDVLAVDLENPLFSAKRARLLRLLPSRGGSNWKADFERNLRSSGSAEAKELVRNLVDPTRNQAFHRRSALAYLARKRQQLSTRDGVREELQRLARLRNQIFRDELSRNPLGQILEPGFRVIFPRMRLK
jgi:hypothetical protein